MALVPLLPAAAPAGQGMPMPLAHSKDPKSEPGALAKITPRPLFEAERHSWIRSSSAPEREQTAPAAIGNNLDDSVPCCA